MNQLQIILQDFKKCLKIAPFPIFSLILYIGLRSTDIMPGGSHVFNGLNHPAYLGWYDFILAYSIILSLATGLIKIEIKDFFGGLFLIYIILQSWSNTNELDKQFIFDGIVYCFRFFLLFILGKHFVKQLGIRTSESFLFVLFTVLGSNALLWYSLQFGIKNRMAASAMTSASFAQVMTVICFIAYYRKYHIFLLLSFVFTFLSFSRTSILLFVLLLIVENRKIISWKILKFIIILSIVGAMAIFALIKFGGDATQVVLFSRFSSDEISSMNGRNDIWKYAWDLIESGKIPLFGIGFNTTPNILQNSSLFTINDEGFVKAVPSFHSIFIEYLLGMGIFSLGIFYYFIKRIWQTFYYRCEPAFFIFTFFFISQSVDFTFYNPKEVIIWSLMLGMAEGQWRHGNSCKQEQ